MVREKLGEEGGRKWWGRKGGTGRNCSTMREAVKERKGRL